MPKYRIETAEVIYQYEVYEIEAESEDEVEAIVMNGEAEPVDAYTKSGNWEITSLEEITD